MIYFNHLVGYNFKPSDIPNQQTLSYHRIIEAFKFAYAKRSELGDEDYVNVTEVSATLRSSSHKSTSVGNGHNKEIHAVVAYSSSMVGNKTVYPVVKRIE